MPIVKTDTTITAHGAAQLEREHVWADAGRVRARPVAAAQQLGPLGDSVRAGRLCRADAGMAGRRRGGRRGQHFAEFIGGLAVKPVVIGHSFGGLLAQILAGRGLATASVAIDPAPSGRCSPCRSRR
jgi:hypothetical protein